MRAIDEIGVDPPLAAADAEPAQVDATQLEADDEQQLINVGGVPASDTGQDAPEVAEVREAIELTAPAPAIDPVLFEPVQYFTISNRKVDNSIKRHGHEAQTTLDAAVAWYERLGDFLYEFGCVATVETEGEWFNAVPRLYGGMFAAGIAPSQEEWTFKMRRLLPPDEGWVLEPVLAGEMGRDADGRFCTLREAVKSRILGTAAFSEVDAYLREKSPPDLAVRLKRWEQAGRSIDLYQRLGRRRDRLGGDERLEWLIHEVIPAGTVVLLAGPREVGKSTLMLELAVAVASDDLRLWLGQPLHPKKCRGIVVILTGEDSDAVINTRLEHLDPDDRAGRIVVYALDGRPLKEIADEIARIPRLSLVIVDPARRYIVGDEDGSGNVSEFFAVLESIVQRTGAAVVVVHHLTKNAAPSTLQQVRETIRGSGVFLDRPRVVLGCFRRGDTTVVGRIKSNLTPEYPIKTAVHLRRDPETLRHLPVAAPGGAEVSETTEDDDVRQKVLDALRQLLSAGIKVTRTGDNELWNKRVPDLEGIGRNRIRRTVDELIEDGVLASGEKGLRLVR